MLPYGRHSIDQTDIEAVVAALRSGVLTQGAQLVRLEDALARQVEADFAVACSSGTAALHMAYAAAGIEAGDTVIVPANTFLATANAAVYLGAEVRFCDVDPRNGLMTAETLEAVIDDSVRAVVPVHFAGQSCDMSELAAVVNRRAPAAVIIEDACHALGATDCDGQPVGSSMHSSMTTFSLHPVKAVAAGEGGAVTTNDRQLADRLKNIRNHGMTKDPESLLRHDEGPWYYEMHQPGFNYRISELACALAASQLTRLDEFIDRRRQIATRYIEALDEIEGVVVPARDQLPTSAWHLFCLHIRFEAVGTTRKQLVASLMRNGIGTQVHYYPVALQPFYQERFQCDESQIPGAVAHYEQALSIPCFPSMSDAEQQEVVAQLRHFIRPHATLGSMV